MLCARLEKRGKSGLVMAPAADRFRVDRLAHLSEASCPDRSVERVELAAGGVPREAGRLDQPPALRLEVGDQIFVDNLVDWAGKDSLPWDRPVCTARC